MRAFYNEIDPYAAAWLRNLIREGLIPAGVVDERSIQEIRPADLAGFTQCHFFAGLGGWGAALRLAGWPDDQSIWTGSCPCQPFSVAGKGAGTADVRHLWPDFFRLIRACRPALVMGEQVAGSAGYGWLDGVVADLAAEGYASRGVDIPACAVDAPHIRSRLYWIAVAHSDGQGCDLGARPGGERGRRAEPPHVNDLADADQSGARKQREQRSRELSRAGGDPQACAGVDVGHSDMPRLQGWRLRAERAGQLSARAPSLGCPHWSDHVWLTGADGKARRAQPGVRLLAHGIPARVGRLRAYGNAIVPQVAAQVIAAVMEAS